MEQKSLIIYSTHKYNKLSIIIDLNAQWLNALFDRDYDNIMNCIIDYVNYGSGSSSDSGVGDDGNTNDDNDNNYDDDDDNDFDGKGE